MARKTDVSKAAMVETNSPWHLPNLTLSPYQRTALARFYSSPTDTNFESEVEAEKMIPKERKALLQVMAANTPMAPLRLQLREWKEADQKLLDKAILGDSDAFLELVGRDPRYLCSDLGLFFVSQWRNQLDFLESLSFRPTSQEVIELNEYVDSDAESARNNIRQISSMLLKAFDGRGKSKRSAPPDVVKRLYYAALTLFAGIRKISRKKFRSRAETVKWIDEFRAKISKIPQAEILDSGTRKPDESDACEYTFLLVIQEVEEAIRSLGSAKSVLFDSDQIITTPSHKLAKELVTKFTGLHERKIDEILASVDVVFTWPLPNGRHAGFVKPPKKFLQLDQYSPIAKILRTK